jgi:hypothetical protein
VFSATNASQLAGKGAGAPEYTLTLHKIGRFLPSAPVILRVWTNIPREKWAVVDERWLFDCGVALVWRCNNDGRDTAAASPSNQESVFHYYAAK